MGIEQVRYDRVLCVVYRNSVASVKVFYVQARQHFHSRRIRRGDLSEGNG